jgi:murein DD-endopeptidase MepM/ murein hydrolase activator NlpD
METLKVTRPVRSKRITQGWNENKACIYRNGKVVGKRGGFCPANSMDFYTSIGMLGHNGIDIATWRGEEVRHSGFYDGWMKIEKDSSGGIGVDVVSNEPLKFRAEFVPDDMKKILKKEGEYYISHVKTRHWHLKAPVGADRKKISYGQIIGLADNTGASSGDHLHFCVKWCDENGNNIIAPNNGYFGAMDFTPFYRHDVYAKDEAAYLNLDPAPLSQQERKEYIDQLNVLRLALLTLRDKLLSL